jgi:hypothetical protein
MEVYEAERIAGTNLVPRVQRRRLVSCNEVAIVSKSVISLMNLVFFSIRKSV